MSPLVQIQFSGLQITWLISRNHALPPPPQKNLSGFTSYLFLLLLIIITISLAYHSLMHLHSISVLISVVILRFLDLSLSVILLCH